MQNQASCLIEIYFLEIIKMMVLKRRCGQSIILDTKEGPAIIYLKKVGTNAVHFLLTLPKEMTVLRADEDGNIQNKRIDFDAQIPSK